MSNRKGVKKELKNPMFNASGCKDLTAYEAIEKVEQDRKDEERIKKLLATIFYVCDLAGFHIEERIVLKDKRTGKVYR
jgi:hypothetical protein